MTPNKRAAFAASTQAARQAAMTAAVSIEVRDDAREVRQQAAAAALHGLAAGLKVASLEEPPATPATGSTLMPDGRASLDAGPAAINVRETQ